MHRSRSEQNARRCRGGGPRTPRSTDPRALVLALATGLLPACGPRLSARQTIASPGEFGHHLPNIVVILADDLGYGDPTTFNRESLIPTVNMDRLAREGMIFTDAHSGSAVCTPTRYGIITGRYAWRSRLKSGVLNGYSRSLIDPRRLTLPRLLQEAGYQTAGIGKWHLGLDWPVRADRTGKPPGPETIDYARKIANGPLALGFDSFFGIPASLDMPPYVYVEDDHVVEPPTEQVAAHSGLEFYRAGPCAPGFRHVDVLPELTRRAVAVIDGNAAEKERRPLFLYFALPAPHTPILPTPEFRGSSRAGRYGDFVCQVDATLGAIIEALDRNAMSENTLLIVTSDNGCSPAADLEALAALGHHPSADFRGAKADIYEGGHRIPFIARWPHRTPAGTRCDHTICLTDLMATAAAITSQPLGDDAAEDSISLLEVLEGTARGAPRTTTVHHSINGSFAIRRGPWKLALCPGSGGWSKPRPAEARRLGRPPVQLFDLAAEVGEISNLESRYPDLVEELVEQLQTIVDRGRSTDGPGRANEGETSIWGPGRSAPTRESDRH